MTLRTHITGGMAVVAFAGVLGVKGTPCEGLAFLAGSVLPDFDLFFASELEKGHRKGLHHLYFWAGLAVLFRLVPMDFADHVFFVAMGGLLHLLMDMVSGKVYFFWGLKDRIGGHVLTTASPQEKLLLCFLGLAVLYLCVIKGALGVTYVTAALVLWLLSLHLSLSVRRLQVFMFVFILLFIFFYSPSGVNLLEKFSKIFSRYPLTGNVLGIIR